MAMIKAVDVELIGDDALEIWVLLTDLFEDDGHLGPAHEYLRQPTLENDALAINGLLVGSGAWLGVLTLGVAGVAMGRRCPDRTGNRPALLVPALQAPPNLGTGLPGGQPAGLTGQAPNTLY